MKIDSDLSHKNGHWVGCFDAASEHGDNSDVDDLLRRCRPWSALNDGKRVAAAALFFNEEGHILLVKPTYREGWHVPGGIAELGESPRTACIREVEEELGLQKEIGRLLCVDWVAASAEYPERLLFFFAGGVLTTSEIDSIKLPLEELSDFRFFATEDALELLPPAISIRVAECLAIRDTMQTLYLENGVPTD